MKLALMTAFIASSTMMSVSARAATDATAAASAVMAVVPCAGEACLGSNVEITAGEFAGDSGSIVEVDASRSTVSVLNTKGVEVKIPASAAVSGKQTACVGNICVGDTVRILRGYYTNQIAYVVNTNYYDSSVTLSLSGGYLAANVYDLALVSRAPQQNYPQQNYPQPYPQQSYPRNYPQNQGSIQIGPIRIQLPTNGEYDGGYDNRGNDRDRNDNRGGRGDDRGHDRGRDRGNDRGRGNGRH